LHHVGSLYILYIHSNICLSSYGSLVKHIMLLYVGSIAWQQRIYTSSMPRLSDRICSTSNAYC